MLYAQKKAKYYVQMEDDIIASPSYASIIRTFAMQQDTQKWFMLEFSSLGFIGKQVFLPYSISDQNGLFLLNDCYLVGGLDYTNSL